jgi:hypothetical protein
MAKQAALTTKLMVGDGEVEEAFTELANVSNISGPGLGVDTEDVTTHDQTTAFEEVVTTILRTGEITLDLVYDPDEGTHDATTGLLKDMEDKTLRNFQLQFPSTGYVMFTFAAYVTGFEPGAPVGGALTASLSVKISGVPVLDGDYTPD